MDEAQSLMHPDGPSRSRWWATIVGAALAVVLWPQSGAGQDYQDRGFYQSYTFSAPTDPTEEWLLAYGGRLYDMWWAVLFTEPPSGDHPAYPQSAGASGAETWRCVTCHGWDYEGRNGSLSAGPLVTGIKGIDGMAGADPDAIAAIIRDDTHGFSETLIPERALRALALFVSKGQIDSGRLIDRPTRSVKGDAGRGRKVFQNVCAICHDYDGRAWITGDADGNDTLGGITTANPWRGLHKVMNGQTYADMPAMRAFDLEVVLDVLAYVQTLPRQ